jgi:regulator of replication initiation timing
LRELPVTQFADADVVPQLATPSVEDLIERNNKLQTTLDGRDECKALRDEVALLQLKLNDVQHEQILRRVQSDGEISTMKARICDLESSVNTLESKVRDYKVLMTKVGDLHGLERPYDSVSFMGKLVPALELHDKRFHETIAELEEARDARVAEVEKLRASLPSSSSSENERLRLELRRLRGELKETALELADFKYHNPRLRERADRLQEENAGIKKRQRPLEEAAGHMQGLLKLAKGSDFSRRHLLAATHSDKMSGENKELADSVCAYVSKQTASK